MFPDKTQLVENIFEGEFAVSYVFYEIVFLILLQENMTMWDQTEKSWFIA